MTDGGITVEVLLFASLRERVGHSRVVVTVPAGATPGDLWARLGLPGTPPTGLRHAVDGHWVDPGAPMDDGAQVALITPVSGG